MLTLVDPFVQLVIMHAKYVLIQLRPNVQNAIQTTFLIRHQLVLLIVLQQDICMVYTLKTLKHMHANHVILIAWRATHQKQTNVTLVMKEPTQKTSSVQQLALKLQLMQILLPENVPIVI